RRMTLAVELKLPPASQRQRILERLADRVGVELTSEEAERLARRLDATPAVLENALRAAKFSGGGSEAVERAALGIVRAVSGVGARRDYTIPDFDATLSKASMDLRQLAESLVSSGNLSFSLCLSGPPGTGKSAFARFLAKELGLEILQKRASDLLGAFVGESEKRIAEAFEEAVESNALLVFDEADSLLYDRTQAVRSWEITQVNEMLTWMEVHPFPVCFTTNLMDRMDSASLRRFTFHIRYEFMDESALRHAYKVFFQLEELKPESLKLENLTPGDFAQASKQAKVLDALSDPDRIEELLADISRNKPGTLASIGFMK
ncbi:MAG: AAA family ATPase, partial [Desulfobulbia bacterium]